MKLDELHELEVIDRKPELGVKEVPLDEPGSYNVVVLNDPVTPAEVVVEAIMYGVGLSKAGATKRMLRAHRKGWHVVATYGSNDLAETVAQKIQNHARHNPNYDHYRPFTRPPHQGPWPLAVEVMEAGK